jgi:hypothetical protein
VIISSLRLMLMMRGELLQLAALLARPAGECTAFRPVCHLWPSPFDFCHQFFVPIGFKLGY